MKNEGYIKTLFVLLIICVIISILAISNGSLLKTDSWFLPILAAQLWTVSLYMKEGTY
jgi:hypothetical protein